tara:strand:+ start:1094 stop:2137 length:1044 start_codon:yes stop_codon:yes gene_type:complete
MGFFDTKEDVIDIELTQYGKSLFSRGKLKPSFYAFFDDDIIYDSVYAGFKEVQNDAEDRIKNKTPRSRTQHVFAGLEENISKLTPAEGSEDNEGNAVTKFGPDAFVLQPLIENEYALGVPLGQSALGSEFAPAWEINYFHGKMTGSLDFVSGSNLAHFRIPQLSSTLIYETFLAEIAPEGGLLIDYIPDNLKNLILEEENPMELGINVDTGALDAPAAGEKIVQVKPDFLLLEILENNADFWKENYDIEVFKISESINANNRKVLEQQQLYFFNPEVDFEITSNHVEHYFHLDVDGDISSKYFCAAQIEETQKRNIISDGIRIVDCPEYDNTRDLYKKPLDDIEEPC